MPSDPGLLVRVSWLYYREDLTHQQISERLGLSRIKVLRLLQEARETGIVHIDIRHSSIDCVETEYRLRQRFGLRDAVVKPTLSDPEALRSELGRAAADSLGTKIRDHCVLGVTWGLTMGEAIRAVQPQPVRGVRIVELFGGPPRSNSRFDPHELAYLLTDAFDAECYGLNVPFIVDTPDVRDALTSDTAVQRVLDMHDQLDLVLVGIGEVSMQSTLLTGGYLSDPGIITETRRNGAVGNIGARFFDIMGRPVPSSIDSRIIGVTLSQLRAAKEVIGVAGGLNKATAILGALRSRLVSTLITDKATAEEVIKLDELARDTGPVASEGSG